MPKAKFISHNCNQRPPNAMRRFGGGIVWALAGLMLYTAFAVDTSAPPEWWQSRGVIKAGTSTVDYAPANQGQLKNFAKAARDEMLSKNMITTGHPIDLMVQSWSSDNSKASDYSPANLGQLKAVVKPFYDRLIEIGVRSTGSYPWAGATRPANDYAPANIGQLKAVFAFDIANLDADQDGMFDDWELQIVNASTTDAITTIQQVQPLDDFDGDRIPNLWEFARKTVPVDAASKPPFDAVVDAQDTQVYATLSAAYGSLDGGDYRSMVLIKRGTYQGGVTMTKDVIRYSSEIIGYTPVYSDVLVRYDDVISGYYDPDPSDEIDELVPIVYSMPVYESQQTGQDPIYADVPYNALEPVDAKKVLWVGELGSSHEDGKEGPVVVPYGGMILREDTVMDGIIFDGSEGIGGAAVSVDSSPHPERPSDVLFRNCIFRHCTSPVEAGAINNNGGKVTLLHCTVHDCAGVDATFFTRLEAIRQISGSMVIKNSIIWSQSDMAIHPAISGDLSVVDIQTSLVQGGVKGASSTNPRLNHDGYLTSNSSAAFDIGSTTTAIVDIHGLNRNATLPDLGADEWSNADMSSTDHLPDWWEQWRFGNMSYDDNSDPDGNMVLNIEEYLGEDQPAGDEDDDGLFDVWEIHYWGNIQAQNGSGNPDGDARTNLQEQTDHTDPTQVDADSDADGDGLLDLWEIHYFGNIQAQNGDGNPDGDGRTNLQEQAAQTNPNQIDADSDADNDGLLDLWEIRYFGNIQAQNGGGNPEGDARTNLQEQHDGTNPTQIDVDSDADSDGLRDLWEISYWGNIQAQNGSGNPDGDARNNLQEQKVGTNPTQVDSDSEADNDGLLDVWEIRYWGNIQAQNGSGNPDGDARNNLQEQHAGTDPTRTDYDFDGDGDGLQDVWELHYWPSIAVQNGAGDPDQDSITNLQEQRHGTSPIYFNDLNIDGDNDGILDSWEMKVFGSLTESSTTDFNGDGINNGAQLAAVRTMAASFGWDPSSDSDNDELTLEQELMIGTNPFVADTDGDGVKDSLDRMPLDPSVGGSPEQVPGAPVLTLTSPPGAILVP